MRWTFQLKPEPNFIRLGQANSDKFPDKCCVTDQVSGEVDAGFGPKQNGNMTGNSPIQDHAEDVAVKRAQVHMKITYTLPRLENERRVSHRFRSKWKRVYRILQRHELRHGRNYRLLAKRLTRELRRLKPQRNCFALKRSAKKLDNKLHKLDIRRNRRFERGERARFTRLQRRIERG